MRVRVGMSWAWMSWAWMMVEREVVRARRKWWSFMIILNCGPFFFGGFLLVGRPKLGFWG